MTFHSVVYAWFTDGRVLRASPDDGTYYFSNVNPSGADTVFQGGASGPLRIWRANLSTFRLEPLTEPDTGATMPSRTRGMAGSSCSRRIVVHNNAGSPPRK